MTLQELILSLRYRLQDVYTQSGTIISAYNADGQRWSSALLLDIVTKGLDQYQQLTSLTQDAEVNTAFAQGNSPFVTISAPVTIATSGIGQITVKFQRILALIINNALYAYQSPSSFLVHKTDPGSSRSLKNIFTILYDSVTKKNELHVVPVPTTSTSALMIYTEYYEKTYFSSGSVVIPVADSGTLMLLDCCEYQARLYEGYYERANAILNSIYISLGLARPGGNER